MILLPATVDKRCSNLFPFLTNRIAPRLLTLILPLKHVMFFD